jgi:hypothetical protein
MPTLLQSSSHLCDRFVCRASRARSEGAVREVGFKDPEYANKLSVSLRPDLLAGQGRRFHRRRELAEVVES